MSDLDKSISNIEAYLTLISNQLSNAMTDGTLDAKQNELGAVMEDVFGGIDSLKERMQSLQSQLTIVEKILNSATRK
jgi:hypothetical protein